MNLKFLPLGSVCLVEDTDLKLVVIGYKAKGYDYVAVDYPIGYETSDSLRYFNHDQIKDLYSYGYKDEFGQTHFASLNDDATSITSDEIAKLELALNGLDDSEDGGNEALALETEIFPPVSEEPPVVAEESVIYYPFVDEESNAPKEVEMVVNEEESAAEETLNFEEPIYTMDLESDPALAVETTTTATDTDFVYEFNTDELLNEDVKEEPQTQEFTFSLEDLDKLTDDIEKIDIQNSMGSYKFDENGFITETPSTLEEVAEESVEEEQVPEMVVEFDDNGSVVLDGHEAIPNETELLFDDVEVPSEVEMEVVETSDDNLDVGTLTTEVSDGNLEAGTFTTPEDVQIFEEVSFSEVVPTADENINMDIPAPETVTVPVEDQAMATFTMEEEVKEEPKKEEKKKRGFFNFGR